MDPERARELLARERERVEETLAGLEPGGPVESDEQVDPGDLDDEGLYEDEYRAGRAGDLRRDLDAIDRAERRLEEGTYGFSVESGEPIPDARLEAIPWAERTVQEQERYGGD
jgi:DnaK suppressor protein